MRYALAFLLALMLALNSLAQTSYRIRLDTDANLRESYSLDSNIVAVLPQGAEVEVLGGFNRWLKVAHADAELWLADWVQYTQLTEGTTLLVPASLEPHKPAQPSQTMIRLDTEANLRELHSLDSEVVIRVAEGSLLPLTGTVNRWLKVVFAGRELWLADWVMHSRLSAEEIAVIYAPPPPPPPPPIIDNCCLVDRNCTSDEEWERGVFDFHANWCPAPEAMTDMSMS
ncbi:MAG: SH3 domain-containing protein, partial [Chloroflexi bacterium]|nr:SH3 domain-containing protein [Chloroflexota bacterium]